MDIFTNKLNIDVWTHFYNTLGLTVAALNSIHLRPESPALVSDARFHESNFGLLLHTNSSDRRQ